jgi:hypothetical protein
MKYIRDIIYIVVIIILTILCVHFGIKEPEIKTETIVKTDTIVKVDTFTIEKEKIKYKERKVIDTLYVYKDNDTIPLEQEQIHYHDSISDIFVSGYNPEIDSIHYKIPEKTVYVDKIVTETITPKESFWKNRFVITAGFSAQYGLVYRNFDIGPYVGIGIRLY